MSQTERAIDADELDEEFGDDVEVFGDEADDDAIDEVDRVSDADMAATTTTSDADESDADEPEISVEAEATEAGVMDPDDADRDPEVAEGVDHDGVLEELDESDEPYELPEIIMATEPEDDDEPDPGADPLIARHLPGETAPETDPGVEDPDDPAVSDDVLEELRRADIDGPTVAFAPQDDTSSGIRRPRRSPDYDPAPFPIPIKAPRVLGRKPRVRRVTRVVRHVDPWSVFKIAIVANLVMYIIALTAGVLLWNVAYATGTVDNVERFFESFGWSSFEFKGGEIFHNGWIGGLFLVIGLTGLAVLFATLFNLITDLVGGMRFTVLEEEVVESRTSPMRRFVVRRAEPEVPAVTYDESGPIIREAVVDDSGSIPR